MPNVPDGTVIMHDMGEGYFIKYDSFREKYIWTAIGPSGRLGGDVLTCEEAMKRMQEDILNKENPDT